jgi:hypothetical protein
MAQVFLRVGSPRTRLDLLFNDKMADLSQVASLLQLKAKYKNLFHIF